MAAIKYWVYEAVGGHQLSSFKARKQVIKTHLPTWTITFQSLWRKLSKASFRHMNFLYPFDVCWWHEKQWFSQRKCREHLSNLPSHHDNATHQGISISQPCYEEKCMEWKSYCLNKQISLGLTIHLHIKIILPSRSSVFILHLSPVQSSPKHKSVVQGFQNVMWFSGCCMKQTVNWWWCCLLECRRWRISLAGIFSLWRNTYLRAGNYAR